MTELLAESDFPAQGYFFILVAIFSFLKWLYTNLTTKKGTSADEEGLVGHYERYHDEFRIQQSGPQVEYTPPLLPQIKGEPVLPETQVIKTLPAKSQPPPPLESKAAAARSAARYTRNHLRAQLSQKNSLRRALILREIIGPPKALSTKE